MEQNEIFTQPIAFLRVGWMNRYQGITSDDSISRGGAYVSEHGYGHEIFNFRPFHGAVYGYVQPPGRRNRWQESRINLRRVGGARDDELVSGVLVVWVATSPQGGARIVGWYRNATLYRNWQAAPPRSNRHHAGVDCGFYATTHVDDAVLLPPDNRTFELPPKGEGGFGQSNIFYADRPELHRDLRLKVLSYIDSGGTTPAQTDVPSVPRQVDLFVRQQVEKIAIEVASDHFTSLGYQVDSVEADNAGWDLNATLGRYKLRVEVKGLSGSNLVVELTRNEYQAMQKFRDIYRVAVVTNALRTPALTVFGYSPDSGQWESSDQRVLRIQEIIAARCSCP